MSAVPPSPAEAEAIRATAERLEPDHYLSALLAPRGFRDDLVVLAAFLGEIRRIALAVSDPMLAEIRLQWWRDAIAARFLAERSGNPVLDAMLSVVARRRLPIGLLEQVIDGASIELHDPVAAADALDPHFDAAYGAAFELARVIMGAAASQGQEMVPLSSCAGRAYGAVRLAHRREPLARVAADNGDTDVTDEALVARITALKVRARAEHARFCDMIGAESRSARLAYLPVALVEPYARTLDKVVQRPGARRSEIMPLTRVTRLWLAARLGRF